VIVIDPVQPFSLKFSVKIKVDGEKGEKKHFMMFLIQPMLSLSFGAKRRLVVFKNF